MYVFIGWLVFSSSVHCNQYEVVWRVDNSTTFEYGPIGCVDEVVSCVVHANELNVMSFAFACNVGA